MPPSPHLFYVRIASKFGEKEVSHRVVYMIATKMILVMVLSELLASLEEGNLLSHHATSLNKFMVQEKTKRTSLGIFVLESGIRMRKRFWSFV